MRGFGSTMRFAVAVAVSTWLASCSLIVDPDVDGLGREPAACEHLACNPCTCQPGDLPSYQLCNTDGEYDTCMCDPAPLGVPAACTRDAGSGGL